MSDYVMAPKEPTEAMLMAGYYPEFDKAKRREMYQAMIAAVPNSPASEIRDTDEDLPELSRQLDHVAYNLMTPSPARLGVTEARIVTRAARLLDKLAAATAAAVLAEREACAALAEAQSFPFGEDYMNALGIAAAIRARTGVPNDR